MSLRESNVASFRRGQRWKASNFLSWKQLVGSVLVALLVVSLGLGLQSMRIIPGNGIGYSATSQVLLQDGFESGNFQAWSGRLTTSGDNATVSSKMPYSGSYSASFATGSLTSGTKRAYCYETVSPALSELYAKGYFFISKGMPLTDNDDRFGLISFEVNGQLQCSFRVLHYGGVDRFNIVGYNGLSSFVSQSTDAVYPTQGHWFEIEFYMKTDSVAGEYRAWIDGVQQIAITRVNTAGFGIGISKVRFGLTSTINVQKIVEVQFDSATLSSRASGTLIDVTIDRGTMVGSNNLSVGFMLSQSFIDSYDQRQLATNANSKLVRLFSVSYEPCTFWNESTHTGVFNWAKLDSVLTKIFQVGAEPLITIGFYSWTTKTALMPPGMATNPNTGLPYSDSFAPYAAEWVKHFKSANLPVKYYEIINEPHQYFGWNGQYLTRLSYYVQLWNSAARSMRSQNTKILISQDTITQKNVLSYWLQYGDNVDYLDFHKYDSDHLGECNDSEILRRADIWFLQDSSTFWGPTSAQKIWLNSRGKSLPVLNTEMNMVSAYATGTDPRIQTMVGAVWTALVLRTEVLKGVSFNVYSSFSSSASLSLQTTSSGGLGFGMINSDNNQPWYPYYVQKWLGNTLAVGDILFNIKSSSSSISGFGWNHNQKQYFMIISRINQSSTLRFHGLAGNLSFSKIDSTISYLAPKAQTGVVDSTQPFAVNGYTVALFQTEPSDPRPFFVDGFESKNLNSWSGVALTLGDNAAVVQTNPYDGVYSVVFQTGVMSSGIRQSCVYENVATQTIHAQGYFYVGSGLPLNDNGDRFALIAFGAGGTTLASFRVFRSGNVDRFSIIGYDGTNGFPSNSTDVIYPVMGRWYCIDFYAKINSVSGEYRASINGVELLSVTGVDTAAFGNVDRVYWGIASSINVQHIVQVYGDSARISYG